MAIYISRVHSKDPLIEGRWAEVLHAYQAIDWEGEHVDHKVLVQPKKGKFVQGDTPLPDFRHPLDGDTLYIFGPDNGHMEVAPVCDAKVYIPQRKLNVTFYADQAAAIVLYDRMIADGDS